MDAAGRENVFVKRPADRAGKYVRLIQDVTLRIILQRFEQRVEVVRRQVDVIDHDGPVRASALPQDFDRDAHRSERILSLRRSIVGNDDGLVAGIERELKLRSAGRNPLDGGPPAAVNRFWIAMYTPEFVLLSLAAQAAVTIAAFGAAALAQ